MSPLYCDFTGKEILPKCGTRSPVLGRDYYVFHDKVVSAEAWDQLQDFLEEKMNSRGFGNYSFHVYQQLVKEFAEKVVTKGTRPRPGRILG